MFNKVEEEENRVSRKQKPAENSLLRELGGSRETLRKLSGRSEGEVQ